jgi:hypothetical protein
MALNIKKAKAALKFLEDFIEEAEGAEDDSGEGEGEDEEDDPPPKKRGAKKTAAKKRTEEDDGDDDSGDDDAPTMNQVRALAVKASKKATDGKEKVIAALEKHGSEKLSDIDEEKYPELIEMLQQIMDDDDFDPREDEEDDPPPKKRGAKKTKPAAKKRGGKKGDDEDF